MVTLFRVIGVMAGRAIRLVVAGITRLDISASEGGMFFPPTVVVGRGRAYFNGRFRELRGRRYRDKRNRDNQRQYAGARGYYFPYSVTYRRFTVPLS